MQKIKTTVTQINEWIAVNSTLAMSTMWMVYVFMILSVLPFFIPAWKDVIGYISSSILQLTALPLIMVGQAILSRSSDARAQQDHETLMAQHAELRKQINILRKLREEEKGQSAALADLVGKIEHRVCDCDKNAPTE